MNPLCESQVLINQIRQDWSNASNRPVSISPGRRHPDSGSGFLNLKLRAQIANPRHRRVELDVSILFTFPLARMIAAESSLAVFRSTSK
jgi:hypothetical protein